MPWFLHVLDEPLGHAHFCLPLSKGSHPQNASWRAPCHSFAVSFFEIATWLSRMLNTSYFCKESTELYVHMLVFKPHASQMLIISF